MTRKKGHYEMVLEDRHLLGVFFAVVLLCALFFTLGFVLGRNQQADQTAEAAPPQAPAGEQPATAPEDLTFYERVEEEEPTDAEAPAPTRPAEPEPSSTPSDEQAAEIYLQVAAVTREDDANRLAGELRNLGFSSRVVPPADGRFYRIQVGPFGSSSLAQAAIRRLKAQGFREVLVKR